MFLAIGKTKTWIIVGIAIGLFVLHLFRRITGNRQKKQEDGPVEKINFPDIDLYHYTTLNSLMAIIQNRTIRLTDYRFLNDVQELTFATRRLKEGAKQLPEDDYTETIYKSIIDIEQGNMVRFRHAGHSEQGIILEAVPSEIRYYVLSLTHRRDDLAMWRMYAQNGCCIKFNSKIALEYFHRFRDNHFHEGLSNIVNGSVLYGDRIEDTFMLRSWLDSKNVLMIHDEILRYSLRRKDPAFSFEDEYRIGIPFEDQMLGNDATKEFILSESLLKPQLELKNFPVEKLIEEIIISPFIASELTRLGLMEFISSKGMSSDLVKQSKIKIR